MKHRTFAHRIVAPMAVSAALVLCHPASAQDGQLAAGRGPGISVSIGGTPSASVKDAAESYGYRDLGLGVSVPLIGGWDWERGAAPRFRLMADARVHAESAQVPYRPDRRSLISVQAGLTGIHVLSRENQLTWSVDGGFAKDNDPSATTKARLTGRVIVLHRLSQTLSFLGGGAFGYALGKGRLLPVIGVLWRPDSGTTIHVLGPLSAGVQHRMGSRLVVGGRAEMRGNQYLIASTDQYQSATGELSLRIRELHIAGEMRLLVGSSLSVAAQAGLAAARRLTLADGKDELFSSKVGPKPFATIGLRYTFSKRPRWDGLGVW
jgi:hypothetical protein